MRGSDNDPAHNPGDNEAIMERQVQKTHGNPLRNKYRAKTGDFVMFADDDNWCVITAAPCTDRYELLCASPTSVMHMCESVHPEISIVNASLTACTVRPKTAAYSLTWLDQVCSRCPRERPGTCAARHGWAVPVPNAACQDRQYCAGHHGLGRSGGWKCRLR